MDYKIKYNEALEKAKKLYGKYCINNVLEDLFPELKESEDERIRKEIIDFVKSKGGFKGDWIAWLEKQGDNKEFDDELEMSVTESQSQPKFKPGDFIMNNDITEHGKPEIFKIIKVCSSWYDVENIYDGRQTMITFSQDYTCHLWTIDDAKQGDILMVDNEFIVVLYRKITDGTEWKDTSILTEYEYDINDNTFTKGSHLFYCDICPATYAQREVLTNYIQQVLNWEK